MTVTRDVIEDLLPLYLAGEASDDTRALVEASLTRDPDLARLARGMAGPEFPKLEEQLTEDAEMRSIKRTKRMLAWKSWLLGLGLFYGLLPFSFVFSEEQGFRWLVLGGSVWPLAFYVPLAAVCWTGYFVLRRKLA